MAVPKRGIGRCACAFALAISFDVAGAALLTWGLFGNVVYFDLLIYCGAILIFLSLVWWIFWYTGNIEVPLSEFDDDRKPSGLERLARTMSRRLTNRFGTQRGASARAHGASTLPSAPSSATGGTRKSALARTRGAQSERQAKYSAVPGAPSATAAASSSSAAAAAAAAEAASGAGAASSMEMKPMIGPSNKKKRGVSFQIRPVTPRGPGALSTFVDMSTL